MTFPRVLHLLLSELQTCEEPRLFSFSCASDQSESRSFCEVLESGWGRCVSTARQVGTVLVCHGEFVSRLGCDELLKQLAVVQPELVETCRTTKGVCKSSSDCQPLVNMDRSASGSFILWSSLLVLKACSSVKNMGCLANILVSAVNVLQ